jgi:hypothetical protein
LFSNFKYAISTNKGTYSFVLHGQSTLFCPLLQLLSTAQPLELISYLQGGCTYAGFLWWFFLIAFPLLMPLVIYLMSLELKFEALTVIK